MKPPTIEQCTENAKIIDEELGEGYAIWYPQMGGYTGRAAVFPCDNGCFEALVWHDGEFPFDEESGGSPAYIHHCNPEQFIKFGHKVAELSQKHSEEHP